MRTVTLASMMCLAIVCTALVSAIFATTLAAGAIAGLPQIAMTDTPLQMTANAPMTADARTTVVR
jgi:hypothetical protein